MYVSVYICHFNNEKKEKILKLTLLLNKKVIII